MYRVKDFSRFIKDIWIKRTIKFREKYGETLPLTRQIDKPENKYFQEIYHYLQKRAKKILPPNTYYEIRRKMPTDFGLNRSIAWYYDKNIEQSFYKSEVFDDYIFQSGYCLLLRDKT